MDSSTENSEPIPWQWPHLIEDPDELKPLAITTLDDTEQEFAHSYAQRTLHLYEQIFITKTWHAEGFRSATMWLAHRHHHAKSAAGRRINQAKVLAEELPLVMNALWHGCITVEHGERILQAARTNPSEATAAQKTFLAWAKDECWTFFHRYLAQWSEYNDPTDPSDSADKAYRDREISWTPGIAGQTIISGIIPNDMFAAVADSLGPLCDAMRLADMEQAKAEHPDGVFVGTRMPRSEGQRRCDALVEALRRSAGSTTDPGVKTVVNIVIDADTLDDELARLQGQTPIRRNADFASRRRCETLRGVPVSPRFAVHAALVGFVEYHLIDRSSNKVHSSRRRRLFTRKQRKSLMIRDTYCREPGCGVLAIYCEADHVTPYALGGPTVSENGAMLCPAGHRWVTRRQNLGFGRAA